MLAIAGLGNPGAKYSGTRHNIGFMITGALGEKHGISGGFSSKFNAITGKGKIKGAEVLLIQPQTYMNLSGEAVSKALNWYKIDFKDLFVIYDDTSIEFGRVRFRPSGSAGGHNGIKSIISRCGNDVFPRLKVGIGPDPGERFRADYVLQPFFPEEKKHLPEIINACVEAVEFYLEKGMEPAMNRYNGIKYV